VTGESLGLLVEEQRTNLLLRSEGFDNASWSKTGASLTADTTLSPSGFQNADTFTNTAGVTSLISQSVAVTASSTNDYCFSLFVKANSVSAITLNAYYSGNTEDNVAFDLAAQTANATSGSPTNLFIRNVGNGWYRIGYCLTRDSTATRTTIASRIWVPTRGNGVIGNSIFLWGAQLEAGAFPTSYIPTTTATVTRSADVASISGSNFSSWYRQDEGTVFAEVAAIGRTVSSPLVQFQDATATDRIQFRQNASATDLAFQVIDGASASAGLATTAFALNTFYKGALAIKASDYAATINSGAISASSTPSTMPTVDQLRFNVTSPVTSGSHLIRRLAFWPQRLANSTLQAVTQ
jgi:hypothetical protein